MSNSDIMQQLEEKYYLDLFPAPNYESLDAYHESMSIGQTIASFVNGQSVAEKLLSGKNDLQSNQYSGVLGNILSRTTLTGSNFDQVYFAAKEQGEKQSELDRFLNDAIQIGALTLDDATELRDARFSSVEDTYLTAKKTGANQRDLDSYLNRAVSAGRISLDEATALREKRLEKDTGLFSENGKWLKKGSDDFGESLLASVLDAISDVSAGIIAGPEGLFRGFAALGALQDDLNFYQNGGIYTLEQEQKHREQAEQAKEGAAELITTDFYDEDSIAKSILTGLGMIGDLAGRSYWGQPVTSEDMAQVRQNREDARKYMDEDMEDDSMLGEQMDGLARSAGQQLFTKAIGGVLPWQLTTGFSTMGDEMAQALNEGATFEEAGVSGMVSAAGEVLSEYIFDADIFGHSSMEEKLVKQISSKVSNKVLQAVMKFGMDATGEGLEEVISGVIGAIGQKLTYGSDKEIKELFSSEEALDSFIGGAIMGGVNSAANTVISKATGTDYVSGLNKSEQAVVDKVYKERLAEAKKDSKNGKVSASEKTAIYNDVLNSLEKGYLSTDSVEAALGGKAYEDYQSLLKVKEDNDALQKYESLRNKKKLLRSEKETLKQLSKQAKQIQNNRNALKQKLDTEVARQVQGTKLQESYAERTRRGNAFEADLSQYEGKQKEIVQKAVESGVLNNTNRTHEFVDLISSIAAQSGVDYDFTNNATLKNSGFAVEGKQVNGYTTAGGVTVNIDSTKALNRVVGHEITHVLEGTELYSQLQTELFNYTREKGELGTRWNYAKEQYKNMDGVDPKQELAAELAGDYLFSDQKFLDKLAQENPNAFQKAFEQIKTFCKIAGNRSKEGKQFEKVKQLYEEAYRKAGEAKKSATKDGGVKYSISETEDGRQVAVVDNDILKDIDTTKWDKETKKKVRQAAMDTLRQFKGGFEINGVEYVGNRNTITEYTKSNYSEALANKNSDAYQDKMRAADVIDDVIHVATDWTKDGKLKHKRSDFVDFVRGKTLFQSGENAYSATVIAGITKNGKAVFYDVVDITPDNFEVKKSGSPSTVLTEKLPDSMQGGPDSESELPTTDPTDKPSHGILGSSDGGILAQGSSPVKYNVSDNSPSTPKTKADVFGSDIMLAPVREDVKPVEITAPTKEDIAKVEQAMNDNFAPIREETAPKDGTKLLTEWAENTKPKKDTPSDKAAKQYLKNTLSPKNMPEGVKEQLGSNFGKVSRATTEATELLLHGNDRVKPLSDIMNHVAQGGFDGEFELYMRHLLNTDRMSLEERGYGDNKQLFPTEVTAAESAKQAEKILKEHPEFKEYESDVRAYVSELRNILVESGAISAETAKLWEEMYPHYIPVRRQGFANDHETWQLLSSIMNGESWTNKKGEVDDDLFAAHTATVAQVHKATGGDQQLYPLFDTLAERTLTAYWNAALHSDHTVQDVAPIGENAVQNNAAEDAIAPTREDIAKMEAPADDFAPIREDAPGLRKNRIEADMDEQSRYEVLREKQIPIVEDTRSGDYTQEIGDIESLPAKAKSKVEKIIKPLAEKLGILNRNLRSPDIDVEFQFSKGKGLKESLNKQLNYGGSYGDFAKALVNLEQILDNAVLIEKHGDKYAGTVRADENLESVSVLVGAFRDGDSIIPVQMEIKKASNRGDQLYVTVAMTKIGADVLGSSPDNRQKYSLISAPIGEADVLGSRPGNNPGQYSLISASDCNIADLFAQINPQDKHFLKYVPDGFLSDAQKTAKQSALQEDADRIAGYAKKPDGKNPTLADDYVERTVLENKLNALKDAGEPYANVEKQLNDLNQRIKEQEKNPDVQPFQKGQSQKQNTPEPGKRTFTTEESADALNVDTPDISAEDTGTDTVEYDPTKVSAEVYRGMNPLKWVREKILDNGMVFEELSHRTGNKDLQALWNYTRVTSGKAQYMIGNGVESKGITSITEIYNKATEAGKLEDFYSYLGHCRNIDGMTKRVRYGVADNQSFMGMDVSLTDSRRAKTELESKHPEFKSWAQQCYDYTDYQIDTLVEHGFLTADDAEVWRDVWQHYVPIKRTSDGNNAGILETMSEQTLHVQSAAAMNDFAVELMHTLNSKISENAVPVDELVSYFDHGSELFQATSSDNGWYYFNCYEDGKLCKFQISQEMYLALKPASDLMKARVAGLADFSEFRRKAITEYNVYFAAKNSIKDAQTVLVQSQHPIETYANMPGAAWDILNDGEYYQEYIANGGDEQQYFHKSTKSLEESVGDKIKKYSGLEAIGDLNNFIETVPRYAEYKVSRMKGASIQVALLDSARVTTNFAAGGELTKFINRNGATFLNASVQGTVQLARTVKEAQMNGVKGWLALAARIGAIGLAGDLLNNLWDDDDDYAALQDYIKQNYFIVGKGEDGTFYRLPKERTWAVIQYATEQAANAATGDATADWDTFFDLCMDNLAPNNPITNNVFSPIVQVAKNETWYHEDLVPRRLQDLPSTERYDDKTSDLSIWLSQQLHDAAEQNTPDLQPELTDVDLKNGIDTEVILDKLGDLSPKEIHYLLDQYSGVIGDLLLPLNTPKAEGKSDSLLGKLIANPLRDIFTTDSVLNNRVTDEFYSLQEELEAKVADGSATPEEQLMNSAIISANVEAGKLYQQQRDLQTSDLPDSEKYERNREIKKKINRLMEDALDDLSDIHIDGNYAEVGDNRYHFSADEETGEEKWWASKETKADGTENWFYTQEYLSHENLGMDYADIWNENYPTDYSDKNLYAEYNGKRYNFDTKEKTWYEITPKKADGEDNYWYQQEQTIAREFGISHEEYWNNRERYSDVLYAGHLWDDATQSYSKDYYTTIRCVLGLEEYAEYCAVLPTLKADKDANGNSIPYSKQNKIKSYINSLDIPDVQKHILYKVYYPNKSTYNYEILNYINNDNNITYRQRVEILEELGASVDERGRVTWNSRK